MAIEKIAYGLVLAAGLGSRLKPITSRYAKPVVPVLNQPVMFYALDMLCRAGVQKIAVNAYYLPRQIEQAVDRWRKDRAEKTTEILVFHEARLMGTGGGAKGLWNHLGRPPGTAVILNGDIVSDFPLGKHLECHWELEVKATMLLTEKGEGRVLVNSEEDRVLGLPGLDGAVVMEGSGRELSFTGASLIESEMIEQLPDSPGCLIRAGLVNQMINGEHIASQISDGVHLDVGTPERYLNGTRVLLEHFQGRESVVACDLPGSTRIVGPVLIDKEVQLGSGCEIGPNVVLGGKSRVADGSRIQDAIAYDALNISHLERTLLIDDLVLKL
jgi:NDP-sugar pyrophosphorylase family protein